ncbi:MAG: phosphoribosylformylglycinamidine cyclo-ligase [Anaerovoracaceae bacterium]|nr:phosphoribosylformylglycinamidine cyclo-ligase [Bacillota bacterium]MDY2670277.1 phosphoribosylformylglycinamidine cyclo-ligase [Anaerovoracaceae bacterium]
MANLTYKDAGVDTKEGGRAVELMKEHVKRTFTDNVLTGLGSFGSLYSPDLKGIEDPVLVAGTDGVGTKLKIAFMLDKHDTVGRDCVAMCVNDIVCQGASPMFFLDYIATGRVKAEKIADIVKGIADGCILGDCSLVGGETAEMPSFYGDNEYDMAGFAVGLVDKKKIIDGSKVSEGDVIIGLPSSGIHSNGYSLVRKIFFDKENMDVHDYVDELGRTLGEALLEPTRIYVKPAKAVFSKYDVHGVVHITGGGFYENIPRIIPDGLCAEIVKGTWEILPVFDYIQEKGGIETKEMFSTFNMGIGMMFVVDQNDVPGVMSVLAESGEFPSVIGKIVKSDKGQAVNIVESV